MDRRGKRSDRGNGGPAERPAPVPIRRDPPDQHLSLRLCGGAVRGGSGSRPASILSRRTQDGAAAADCQRASGFSRRGKNSRDQAVRSQVAACARPYGSPRGAAAQSRVAALVRALLRLALSVSQVRPGARPGVRLRRHGACRGDLSARGSSAVSVHAQRNGHPRARAAPVPRDLTPVVRRFCDHALVRRLVAEGRVRQFHGCQGGRGAAPGAFGLERLTRAQDRRLPDRHHAGDDADLPAALQSFRGEIRLRQHRLRESAGGIAPGRVLRRRAGLPPGGAAVPERTRLCGRRLERPRRGARACLGPKLKRWAEAWVKRRGMPEVRLAWDTDRDGRPKNTVLEQHNALNEGGTWPMKLRVFALSESGLPRSTDVLLRGGSTSVRGIDGIPEVDFAFANFGDYGYGRFLLDPMSREAVLARPEIVQGDLLRALVFGSLWESVRDAELAPLDYLDLVVRVAPVERDPVTLAGLLQRAQVAFLHYASDPQRDTAAESFEQLLAEGMLHADTPGRRITFLRAFTASAWSESGRSRLKSLLANTLEIPGVKLSSRDRFRAIARLLALDDPEAKELLSAQIAADSGDDGRRSAFAAAAAGP